MASGHVNRTNRPNTWLHRPATRREDSPCQLGAVHTWHLTDLPILHNHVRLARQTGNHLNLLSISADDPLQTSGASLRSRPRSSSRPRSISGEGGGDPKSRNLIDKCSLRLVARNTAYMLRL